MSFQVKYILIAVTTLIIVLAGYVALGSKEDAPPLDSTPYNQTLSGTYVCLPHVDTTGSQTDECTFGLKADEGDYYAVNFGASASAMQQFQKGEHITAEGFVVIKEALSSNQWATYNMKGIFTITNLIKPAPTGSMQGSAGTLTTFLGGSVTGLSVTLQPKEVVSDSRCPESVQCIWAGMVEVRVVMSTPVSHGEQTLKLGEPVRFGDYMVTLSEVTPYPKPATTIPESSYRFTFKVEKRNADSCAPGTTLVGEGCMPLKDECEVRGNSYYFDEVRQECLMR